jgi:hypothetical protein
MALIGLRSILSSTGWKVGTDSFIFQFAVTQPRQDKNPPCYLKGIRLVNVAIHASLLVSFINLLLLQTRTGLICYRKASYMA